MTPENYFKTISHSERDGRHIFEIEIDGQHDVFKGHFPGNPISPGVCNVGIIEACAESVTGGPIMLDNVKQCKFTNMIRPDENCRYEVNVAVDMAGDAVKIVASIEHRGKTYVTLKAEGRRI